MHPVKKQIGKDVISGREAMYPDFDLSELETLIEHQKQGREAAEIYHSYWWTDEVPQRVKKIAAYTPVWFQDDFIIVSAVIDYDEIAAPISQAMISISLLTIALMTTFVVVLYKLRISSIARDVYKRQVRSGGSEGNAGTAAGIGRADAGQAACGGQKSFL